MNLIERVKNMIITPKTEWEVVKLETATPMSILTGYVLPLAVVACLSTVLGYLLFWRGTFGYTSMWMIGQILITLISYLLSFYISVLVIDMLAASFSSEKNQGRSAQLVGYSLTPMYVGALFSFIPLIGWLIALAGSIYSIYLLYLGIGPMKKTPEDKKVVYIIVSAVVIIPFYFVLAAILALIILPIMGIGALSSYRNY